MKSLCYFEFPGLVHAVEWDEDLRVYSIRLRSGKDYVVLLFPPKQLVGLLKSMSAACEKTAIAKAEGGEK